MEEPTQKKKKKRKLLDEADDLFEVDEDSDHVIHERYAKEGRVQR